MVFKIEPYSRKSPHRKTHCPQKFVHNLQLVARAFKAMFRNAGFIAILTQDLVFKMLFPEGCSRPNCYRLSTLQLLQATRSRLKFNPSLVKAACNPYHPPSPKQNAMRLSTGTLQPTSSSQSETHNQSFQGNVWKDQFHCHSIARSSIQNALVRRVALDSGATILHPCNFATRNLQPELSRQCPKRPVS